MFKTRVVKLPSGRSIKVLAGQRLTAYMRQALDEQYAEWDEGSEETYEIQRNK